MKVTVRVNEEEYSVCQNISVKSLIEELALESQAGFAIAVNDKVVSRSNWSAHTLKENDEILIITAAQGG